jgi:excisionase family DNA binding protein
MAKLMTIQEVAQELRISLGTARNRISRGEPMPPSIQFGRKRLFPAAAFDKWVASLTSYPIEETQPETKPRRGRPPITKRGSRKKKSTDSNRNLHS